MNIENNYKRMLMILEMWKNSTLMKQINGLMNLKKTKPQKNIEKNLKIMIMKKFTEIRVKIYYKNCNLKMIILMNYMQYIVNMKNQ